MKILLLITVAAAFCAAQTKTPSTINLDVYKNKSKYAVAETTLTVKAHTFRLLNIKPLAKSDTACISAVVIDKRKLLFYDVNGTNSSNGLMVPQNQPLSNAVIVLKGSPNEGKALIFFTNGKLVTLPGDKLIVDNAGSTVYCVWANDSTYRLTVFDCQRMRVVVPTTVIARPEQWYTNGMDYIFKESGTNNYYSVSPIARSVSKMEKADNGAEKVSYLPGFESMDKQSCCGPKAWGWK
jgi:hypothetical protein